MLKGDYDGQLLVARKTIEGGHSKIYRVKSVKIYLNTFFGTYFAQAGILSRKKLALDEGLVITLFRCPCEVDGTPGCSEPLDPGIGCSLGTTSSCSVTTRMVEPVKSLR